MFFHSLNICFSKKSAPGPPSREAPFLETSAGWLIAFWQKLLFLAAKAPIGLKNSRFDAEFRGEFEKNTHFFKENNSKMFKRSRFQNTISHPDHQFSLEANLLS